jgi:hypothetical protein
MSKLFHARKRLQFLLQHLHNDRKDDPWSKSPESVLC